MPDMLVRLWKLDYNGFRKKEAEITKTTCIRFLCVLSPSFKK